jgi:alpha-ribazole phosphatase
MSNQEVVIDLLRHGEPEGGRAYRGNSIDDPLSERGWQQMRDAAGEFAQWDLIVTSPMRRCCAFAEEFAQKIRVAVQIEPEFREVGFGAWEGKTPDEIIATDSYGYESFNLDPEQTGCVQRRPAHSYCVTCGGDAGYSRGGVGCTGCEHVSHKSR